MVLRALMTPEGGADDAQVAPGAVRGGSSLGADPRAEVFHDLALTGGPWYQIRVRAVDPHQLPRQKHHFPADLGHHRNLRVSHPVRARDPELLVRLLTDLHEGGPDDRRGGRNAGSALATRTSRHQTRRRGTGSGGPERTHDTDRARPPTAQEDPWPQPTYRGALHW